MPRHAAPRGWRAADAVSRLLRAGGARRWGLQLVELLASVTGGRACRRQLRSHGRRACHAGDIAVRRRRGLQRVAVQRQRLHGRRLGAAADVAGTTARASRGRRPGCSAPPGSSVRCPIPASAVQATGSDGELSIYSPSTDQLWEFWHAYHAAERVARLLGRPHRQRLHQPGLLPRRLRRYGYGPGRIGAGDPSTTCAQGVINHAVPIALASPADADAVLLAGAALRRTRPDGQRDPGGHPPAARPHRSTSTRWASPLSAR